MVALWIIINILIGCNLSWINTNSISIVYADVVSLHVLCEEAEVQRALVPWPGAQGCRGLLLGRKQAFLLWEEDWIVYNVPFGSVLLSEHFCTHLPGQMHKSFSRVCTQEWDMGHRQDDNVLFKPGHFWEWKGLVITVIGLTDVFPEQS